MHQKKQQVIAHIGLHVYVKSKNNWDQDMEVKHVALAKLVIIAQQQLQKFLNTPAVRWR